MQRGCVVKRIKFEDYMKLHKLNCSKPNYTSNSVEMNLGRSGTSPAERDVTN